MLVRTVCDRLNSCCLKRYLAREIYAVPQ
jgi:hypothetical protein